MQLDLSGFTTTEVLIIGAIGIALILFGYRIKKVAFFLIWFILGFYLTNLALPNITQFIPDNFDVTMVQSLLPIGGGLLLALLGFSIEKLCVSGICFALVMLITVQYFGTEIQTMVIGGIVAVLVAGFAVMAMKPATIIATAAAGAYTVTVALLVLVPTIDKTTWYLPCIAGLTVLGSIIQFVTTKRLK